MGVEGGGWDQCEWAWVQTGLGPRMKGAVGTFLDGERLTNNT